MSSNVAVGSGVSVEVLVGAKVAVGGCGVRVSVGALVIVSGLMGASKTAGLIQLVKRRLPTMIIKSMR